MRSATLVARPLPEWLTTFQLVTVVLDPFTYESGWIIDTAGRVLRTFEGADCRVGWIVTGTADEARQFLGPWANEMLTFVDPDRAVVKALGVERLPTLLHVRQDNVDPWYDFTNRRLEGIWATWEPDPDALPDEEGNIPNRPAFYAVGVSGTVLKGPFGAGLSIPPG